MMPQQRNLPILTSQLPQLKPRRAEGSPYSILNSQFSIVNSPLSIPKNKSTPARLNQGARLKGRLPTLPLSQYHRRGEV